MSVILLKGGKHCRTVKVTVWCPFGIRNFVPRSVLKVTYCMYNLIKEMYVTVLEMSVVTTIDSRADKVFQWPKRRPMSCALHTEISAVFRNQWHETKIMSKINCDGPVRLTARGYSIWNLFSSRCMPFVDFYRGWHNDALNTHYCGWLVQFTYFTWKGSKGLE
jgi:hypothetical protein